MYAKDKTTIIDRREFLRVKLKNLAQEAALIRREEKKSWGALRTEMWRHRIGVVRWEARHTHLAYGFIRGLTIEMMEPPGSEPYDEAKVKAMVKKYGPPLGPAAPTAERIARWTAVMARATVKNDERKVARAEFKREMVATGAAKAPRLAA